MVNFHGAGGSKGGKWDVTNCSDLPAKICLKLPCSPEQEFLIVVDVVVFPAFSTGTARD